jgi:hypothetical protein
LTEEEYEAQVNTLVAENSQVFFEQGRMYMFRKQYRNAISAYEAFLFSDN